MNRLDELTSHAGLVLTDVAAMRRAAEAGDGKVEHGQLVQGLAEVETMVSNLANGLKELSDDEGRNPSETLRMLAGAVWALAAPEREMDSEALLALVERFTLPEDGLMVMGPEKGQIAFNGTTGTHRVVNLPPFDEETEEFIKDHSEMAPDVESGDVEPEDAKAYLVECFHAYALQTVGAIFQAMKPHEHVAIGRVPGEFIPVEASPNWVDHMLKTFRQRLNEFREAPTTTEQWESVLVDTVARVGLPLVSEGLVDRMRSALAVLRNRTCTCTAMDEGVLELADQALAYERQWERPRKELEAKGLGPDWRPYMKPTTPETFAARAAWEMAVMLGAVGLAHGESEDPKWDVREAVMRAGPFSGQDCVSCGGPVPQSYMGEVDQLRVQLAGCSVAALGGTKNPARRGTFGWSPAYQDVLDLRLRYDAIDPNLSEGKKS